MLVIQSGFKTDLEANRSIFILYMNNGSVTYNCSIDYSIISNATNPEQVLNAIVPMLQSLCNSVFHKPEEVKLPDKKQDEPKPESETSQ